jgi:hypothetical protein
MRVCLVNQQKVGMSVTITAIDSCGLCHEGVLPRNAIAADPTEHRRHMDILLACIDVSTRSDHQKLIYFSHMAWRDRPVAHSFAGQDSLRIGWKIIHRPHENKKKLVVSAAHLFVRCAPVAGRQANRCLTSFGRVRLGLLTVPSWDSACRRFHVPRWLDSFVPLAAAK